MKAKEGVLDNLNKILRAELTAVHQYLLHAGLCKSWGYMRLHHELQELAQGEVKHASQLIDHILYLDGAPDVREVETIATGPDVKQLFERDLEFEKGDAELLRTAIAHCENVADFTTRHMLEHMIMDTEEHIDWFETQLRTVEQIGLPRYLSEQM
ncbi:MAG TPA: bacterioferritin [Nitrospiraceae bacterium]|nr:bacterioferritin [Nitrospiraceae bacterium]